MQPTAAAAHGRLLPALGALAVLAALLAPIEPWAEPITGDPSAGRGPLATSATISCGLEPDGTSTCAVARGTAAVCPARAAGEDIERSYRLYDYMPAEGGCTLPAEYWRTHSREGGAPFDDTWDLLGDDAETKFFNAPQTHEQILAAGIGEGPYYRLARPYIAAQLNSSNGAPLPAAVAKAFEEATDLFLAADPARLETAAAARFEALAAELDDFNAGVAGPGACGPPPEPLSSADLGKVLEGLETRDAGTVVAVDERYGRGGVLTIRPEGEGDQFLTTDEAFTLGGARKAEFTTVLADCVDVPAGQQTTVEAGGLPSEPQLASAAFLGRERLMRVLVAINDPAQATEVAPAAGATATRQSAAPAFPSGATATGGGGGAAPAAAFPSATLPSVGGTGGGGGDDFVLVPDVVGTTVVEATSILAGVGLRVGNVTTTQQLAMLAGIIGVAQAQENMIVIDQNPEAGALVSLDDPPAVDLEVEAPPAAIPEPGSLLLFATGLALIVIAMLRRRAG
ncbi:MAG TPA: PASTA domain-containing protein [Geminicoccaceae bacterium]|nr:PASTA domain-containing protein [Geminicoccaceae bacterium]